MLSISTVKLKLVNGSTRAIGFSFCVSAALLEGRAAVPDPDAHHDEFSRVGGPHADLDVQAAQHPLALGIEGFVDPYVEGVLWRGPAECAVLVGLEQEVADGAPQPCPQLRIVGSEDRGADPAL